MCRSASPGDGSPAGSVVRCPQSGYAVEYLQQRSYQRLNSAKGHSPTQAGPMSRLWCPTVACAATDSITAASVSLPQRR